MLIASTSEVYGKSDAIPFNEEGDLVTGPTSRGRWSYACSKAIDEFLALAYWKERRLRTVVVRLFNTVGPRQTGQYGMVVPKSYARRWPSVTCRSTAMEARRAASVTWPTWCMPWPT